MAISFSRPDPSSPAAVADASFGTGRRGFDQQEVRDFLRMVAAELARLQERERVLERELRAAQQQQAAAAGSDAAPAVDEESVTRLLGEETARILTIARESAAQIKARAEDGAARLLREATEEANRQREEAELEAARRRSDAQADAEAELAMAKQQGREMVEEARAYRERVLSELARRRELARQQIDQLIHGRDRLVQAFERARLVASDVVAELTPLSEPDEYVDLSPTTGPVPLTVPAGRLADQSSVGDARMPGEEPDADNPFVTDATGEIEVDADAVSEAESEQGPGEETPAADEIAERADAEADADEASDPSADAPVAEDEVTAGDEGSADEATTDDDQQLTAGETADPEATQDAATAAPSAAAGQGNVLPFPSPGPPADEVDDVDEPLDELDEADGVEVDELDDDDEVTARDVDDLFARLRANQSEQATAVPAAESAGDEAEADSEALEEATPFAAREAAIVPLIVAGARKLKRALADEQNEVLDALRRKEPVRSLDVLVPWESEQSERYASAVTSELVAAAQAGAASMGGTADVDLGPDGPLAPAREALSAELVTPLRERLTRAVEDADGDNDVIAKKVRGIYREWKTQRIDEQLDDLFRGMYARAAFHAIEPGTRVHWIVDPDGPPSPDCEDNSLAEPLIVGDAFPTGHACPPAHPGCRCLLSNSEE